jgi:hypothetical protein
MSWAESTFAETIALTPARIFRKKPRLLLMVPPHDESVEVKDFRRSLWSPTETEMICAEEKGMLV